MWRHHNVHFLPVADLTVVRTGVPPPPSRNFFRFLPAKTDEKRVYTTLDKRQMVIFVYNPSSLLFKILDPPLAFLFFTVHIEIILFHVNDGRSYSSTRCILFTSFI